MFFVGVFGIEDKQKEIKTIKNLSCKNCSNSSELVLFKQYSFFHFFFIPMFKWNIRYYLICNGCNTIYEIPKEKGIRAEEGDDTAITYWDLNNVNIPYYGTYNNKHRCKSCGEEIEANFEYCPYCGKRQLS
ncbi:zinc ribbon domain-containing protein [Clostridium sp. CX1]|uniref:zinc ribbon domain-containing protein n=1 Tax=Clostridium sp. CX1 TaxID=2978346 RepID=UPI0021C14426|nr:zinc ribbon domain-containing protein [Clostridium sp. CX1]MCT8975400.1 zinc ribbon domain-containing protein [Clostridium sp. CX1]